MKKLFRLVPLFLIPGLLLIFFNVALAGPRDPKTQANEYFLQPSLSPGRGSTLANQDYLQVQSITGLSFTYTSPVFAHLQTLFTATTTGGTLPIYYTWSFGDGTVLPADAGAVVSHTYAATGTYTVVVTAFNIAGPVSQSTLLTVINPPHQLYLPIIFKNFTPPIEPADLICSLSIDPPTPSAGQTVLVKVQIENLLESNADGFWVDLYINPTTVPTTGHLIPWQKACGPSPCPRGIAWRISNAPLLPGITRTLVSIPDNFHPNGFDPAESRWAGSLPTGTYNLYAYVDSINNPEFKNIDGAVFESNEGNNRCEILGLLVPPSNVSELNKRPSNSLPARPTP